MSTRKTAIIILAFLALIVVISSVYQVNEGQRAILLRFGKVVNDAQGQVAITKPGIHFKIPVVQQVRIFDIRLQTLDIQSSRIMTEEKKDVLVDYFIKWRIRDLKRYYTSTDGRSIRARTLLEQKLNDGLRAEFGKRNISEVVSGERSDIMSLLQKAASESARGLGIEVTDVRIKRIDLPEEVSHAVFERMRAERKRIANGHRAEGRAQANAIRANTDADVTVILATATAKSKKIRSRGDMEAALIYAKTYSKDAEFYAFYRSLLAYSNSFQAKDFIVIGPNSQFFKYFQQSLKKND
jgi:modulator of FtsH protease HflC